jgi:nucleotide-binding universal stress UspA family protein
MTATKEPELDPPVTGGIVVGFDGSPLAERALAWAVAEGGLRGMPVHVVRAWVLATAIPEADAPFGSVPSMDECQDAVAARLGEATGSLGQTSVRLHRHVVHGPAARTLIAAAAHADLLVVGGRGRGGFIGLRLGSVAEQVVRHAPCTVVVVR